MRRLRGRIKKNFASQKTTPPSPCIQIKNVSFQNQTDQMLQVHERASRKLPPLCNQTLLPARVRIEPNFHALNFVEISEYSLLVENTFNQNCNDKCGLVYETAPSVIERIEKGSAKRFATGVQAVGSSYWRVIGEAQDLLDTAKQIGQRWLCGVGFALQLEKMK